MILFGSLCAQFSNFATFVSLIVKTGSMLMVKGTFWWTPSSPCLQMITPVRRQMMMMRKWKSSAWTASSVRQSSPNSWVPSRSGRGGSRCPMRPATTCSTSPQSKNWVSLTRPTLFEISCVLIQVLIQRTRSMVTMTWRNLLMKWLLTGRLCR